MNRLVKRDRKCICLKLLKCNIVLLPRTFEDEGLGSGKLNMYFIRLTEYMFILMHIHGHYASLASGEVIYHLLYARLYIGHSASYNNKSVKHIILHHFLLEILLSDR